MAKIHADMKKSEKEQLAEQEKVDRITEKAEKLVEQAKKRKWIIKGEAGIIHSEKKRDVMIEDDFFKYFSYERGKEREVKRREERKDMEKGYREQIEQKKKRVK